jgi:hypothetical protein
MYKPQTGQLPDSSRVTRSYDVPFSSREELVARASLMCARRVGSHAHARLSAQTPLSYDPKEGISGPRWTTVAPGLARECLLSGKGALRLFARFFFQRGDGLPVLLNIELAPGDHL